MKKNIFKAFALFMAAASLSSCLKDDSLVLDPEQGHNVIEFVNTTDISVHGSVLPLYAHSYNIGPDVTLPVSVSYSGPENVAPQDITVNIAVAGDDVVKLYNDNQHSTYEKMPATAYSVGATSVVIPKGQKRATFQVTFKPSTFDLSKSMVLPLTITSASTGVVSKNFGTILLNAVAKNKYDGIYVGNGSAVRGGDPVLTGKFPEQEWGLVTTGPNSVQMDRVAQWGGGGGIGGIGGFKIAIDPVTNNITVTDGVNPAVVNNPAGVNKYFPETKTIKISVYWGTGPTNRAWEATFVYNRPR
jgi:hypothetical protein